ncbi:hypothetical protein [Microvirga puerhi]|uniref:Uncharacterized protein n=1 Tax=Microvirga puerhi TaxID=2876078 RepID=A0ABS7VMW9_9HYPH|nr:hypothetical protein [Microvirga puerhi]MBZ6076877.1 hypothetical protein [Microvirga puerhi]
MKRHLFLSTLLTCAIGAVGLSAAPASALTMKECSAKYKEAQSAGTLGTMKWNDFRKTQCAANAPGAAATTTSPAAPATTGAVAAPQKQPSAVTAQPAAPAMKGNAVFPSAVSTKYSSESAGKARMHTCLDQYKANQAGGANGNGGLKWIEKGGGYYSQCNAHLKG